MKTKKLIHIILFNALVIITGFGCNKVTDLQPINELADDKYWQSADQFKFAANEFYTYLRTFGDEVHSDSRSDLMSGDSRNVFSSGSNALTTADPNWNNAYTRIRAINYLLDKGAAYANPAEITKYVAEAKFFRAYIYFDLLEQFGGVPIITKPLDITSPELQIARNTRDEVVDFIIKDLEEAIPALPLETANAAADKGRVTMGAAQSFLSRVALYEGTWQKFRAGNAARYNTFFDKAIAASNAVITSNNYYLFGTQGASVVLGDSAQKYMFILEDQKSNPASLPKSANQEYVLANRYDFNLRQTRQNITQGSLGNTSVNWITRKLATMYLTQNGLPIEDPASGFTGYATTRSEYQNRDNRMKYTFMIDGNYYWDNENPGSRRTWLSDAADLANSRGKHNGAYGSGYQNQKWGTERSLQDNEESYDYPVIRMAEVYLNYAEAVYERNDAISDQDLNKSLNLVRNRVNKTMPKLSNAFAAANNLNMRTEIRRERTIELFYEGFRLDDLKRWKTAEVEMPKPLQGITWTGTQWQTRWPALSGQVVNGIYNIESSRKWDQKNYLYPIPTQQIQLNPNLQQNPGW